MELLTQFINIFLHIDTHLAQLAMDYGTWLYVILFIVVFCETGLVVTPFLPGDSLLFATGALAGGALTVNGVSTQNAFDVNLLAVLLFIAAVLGDAVNYAIGRKMGPAVFERKKSRVFRPEYLARTHQFFEKYGSKTIVIARFVPIVRTFAPFVAGVGKMHYPTFLWFNVAGGILWVMLCTVAGYFFGNIEAVKKHFELVVVGIVLVSVLPIAWEWWASRRSVNRP